MFINQTLYTKVTLVFCLPIYVIRPIISGFAHTFHAHNATSSIIWWNLDFISIILVSALGAIIWIHFILYCDRNLQTMFLVCLGAFFITTLVITINTKESSLRETVLSLFIFFTQYFVFGYHLLQIVLEKNHIPTLFTILWACGLVSVTIGVVLRMIQFPESFLVRRQLKHRMSARKWRKLKRLEKRDPLRARDKLLKELNAMANEKKCYYYVGTSHNWWHVFVNGLHFFVTHAVLFYLDWRSKYGCESFG